MDVLKYFIFDMLICLMTFANQTLFDESLNIKSMAWLRIGFFLSKIDFIGTVFVLFANFQANYQNITILYVKLLLLVLSLLIIVPQSRAFQGEENVLREFFIIPVLTSFVVNIIASSFSLCDNTNDTQTCYF